CRSCCWNSSRVIERPVVPETGEPETGDATGETAGGLASGAAGGESAAGEEAGVAAGVEAGVVGACVAGCGVGARPSSSPPQAARSIGVRIATIAKRTIRVWRCDLKARLSRARTVHHVNANGHACCKRYPMPRPRSGLG